MGSATRLGTALAVAGVVLAGPLAGSASAADAPMTVFPAGLAGKVAAVAGVPALAPAPGPPGAPGDEQSGDEQPGGGPVAGSRVFVEISPGAVQPGYLVGIRASCRDNSVPAMVVSDAFGRVAVRPEWGLLTASPMIRERVWAGNYPVKLECRDGETAKTMVQVVKKVPSPAPTHAPTYQPAPNPPHPPAPRPSRGPNTGFGGTAGSGTGGLLLPGGVALAVAGVTIGVATRRRPRAASRR
ncbi:hypothetical protein [Micromonospora sp. CA-111912]|uniref:hypothetical protein n=1 Tax=Micromonospora sp. CA-111912 TaxID=3239955 RepID=UPI003D90F296